MYGSGERGNHSKGRPLAVRGVREGPLLQSTNASNGSSADSAGSAVPSVRAAYRVLRAEGSVLRSSYCARAELQCLPHEPWEVSSNPCGASSTGS